MGVWTILAALVLLCLAPSSAAAYVGPGAGLTVIGAAFALAAGAVLAVVGFVWYPIKRLLRYRRSKTPAEDAPMDTVAH